MNKLKLVKESLIKDTGLDIDELIKLYANELSVADIAKQLNTNPYLVNKVLYALQLRRKKKHRQADYNAYLLQSSDSSSSTIELVDKLGHELNYAYDIVASQEEKLTKANYELSRLKRLNRNSLKESAAVSILFDEITKATSLIELPKYELKPQKTISEHGLVAIYGDTHYGEEIKSNEVPNNEYSYEIAKGRIDRFIDAIIMNPKQSNNLVLIDLKDTIKGVIHKGIDNTEGGFITSIIKAVEINVYLYSVLSSVYDTVTVYTTGSNHERLDDYITSDKKYLDYGRLIDAMVSMHLKALKIENVNILTTDTGYNMCTLNGANILIFHGDTCRNYRPYDGAQRSLLQDICTSLFDTTYRHAINGHGHQFIACHNQYNGMSIQNGTTVGSNTYGLQNGMRPIFPSQTICFVEHNGNIEDIKAVNLCEE